MPGLMEDAAVENSSDPLFFVVGDEFGGQRVDRVLSQLLGVPRSRVVNWIDQGRVSMNDQRLDRASRKVQAGFEFRVSPPTPVSDKPGPQPMDLEILFEDRDLIVIDKPAGLVVHPGPGHRDGTLVNGLLHHCAELAGAGGVFRPGIVHRLDRGTSGVMVAAKNDETHAGLSTQFRDHSIERIYHAFVRGTSRVEEGTVDRPIGRHVRDRKKMSTRSRSSRAALTRWRVVERFPAHATTLLEIRPETGRTHQIRVHLASIGLPIHGDEVYGRARKGRRTGLPPLARPALHASVLGFTHPGTQERLRFEAPFPKDLARWIDRLKENANEDVH
ncbi:MAG: RluA family pseudouridine synthase [Myxococcota bacterium]|nr:RluA family pseudouridine synthase [Myxococcota bacterium]